MADPRETYKVGNTIFVKDASGAFTELKAPESIASGKEASFKPTTAPMRIPAREKILAEASGPLRGNMGDIRAQLDPAGINTPRNTIAGILSMAAAASPIGRGLAVAQRFPLLADAIKGGVGAAVGDIAGQALTRPIEEVSPGEAAQQGLLDAGMALGFGGLGKLVGAAGRGVGNFLGDIRTAGGTKEAIYKRLLGSSIVIPRDTAGNPLDVMPKIREAINAGAEEVPMTVGMVTGQSLLEDLLTPAQKAIARQQATEANLLTVAPSRLSALGKPTPGATKTTFGKDAIAGAMSSEEAGRVGMQRSVALREKMRAAENALFDKVAEIAQAFTRPVPTGKMVPGADIVTPYGKRPGKPTPEIKNVAGPINVEGVRDYAKSQLPDILSAIEAANNSPALQGPLKQVAKQLEAFSDAKVLPYADVRALQANINRALYENEAGLLPKNERRILRELKKRLDADTLDSMEMLWPAGAKDLYQEALGESQKRFKIFTSRVNKQFMEAEREQLPENFWKGAFDSPGRARKMASIAGKDLTAGRFLQNFMEKYTNEGTGQVNGQALLREWSRGKTQEVARQLLTGEQRKAIDYFAKRQSVISGDPSNIGLLALKTQEANAALGAASDLAQLPGNPSRLFSSGATKVAAVIGLTKFSEKVLLNPAKARLASRLLSVNPSRPGAAKTARDFILGANLGRIILRSQNGEEVEYDTKTGEATKVQE
jgi:hypothetical protein